MLFFLLNFMTHLTYCSVILYYVPWLYFPMIFQLIHTNTCSRQFSYLSSQLPLAQRSVIAKCLHASVFNAEGDDISAQISVEHLWMP